MITVTLKSSHALALLKEIVNDEVAGLIAHDLFESDESCESDPMDVVKEVRTSLDEAVDAKA
jgi:hypothetical protein